MPRLSMMMFDNGTGTGIRCRFISEWYKSESFVPDTERLLSEIEKNDPDVILIDMDVYARIDGIETSRMIRSKFNVPVMYRL